MLESVTLAEVVQLVVKVLVDLAASTVLDEKTAENSKAAHPENLLRHTGVGGTLALTVATVATLTAGEVQLTSTGARVLSHGLADDEAIGDELSDRLARVGVGDFRLLVGVEPDLALAAANDRRGQALLSSKIDPMMESAELALFPMEDCGINKARRGTSSLGVGGLGDELEARSASQVYTPATAVDSGPRNDRNTSRQYSHLELSMVVTVRPWVLGG